MRKRSGFGHHLSRGPKKSIGLTYLGKYTNDKAYCWRDVYLFLLMPFRGEVSARMSDKKRRVVIVTFTKRDEVFPICAVVSSLIIYIVRHDKLPDLLVVAIIGSIGV